MKTTIGGDRLGSGSKNSVDLKTYNRSSHDLGFVWKSTMASGTLVPFMTEVGLPGDTMDIELDCDILTQPTVGPLFGSYKVQLDIFKCPIRLYQGELHMNMQGIGLDMSKIKLPQIELEADGGYEGTKDDNSQINASSILSYLNIRGLGRSGDIEEPTITRRFNGVPYLAYWDIYKQYYANKQEEIGVVIATDGESEPIEISRALFNESDSPDQFNILEQLQTFTPGDDVKIYFDNWTDGDPIPNGFAITNNYTDITGLPELLHLQFESYSFNDRIKALEYFNYNKISGKRMSIPQQKVLTFGSSLRGKPKLVEFPLENIDEVKKAILKHDGGTPYIVGTPVQGKLDIKPYDLVQRKFSNKEGLYAKQFSQEGLGIKTYQSDLFNNWMNTEWIEGDNGINEITNIDTSDGSFSIDTLNLARKVYDMLNRIAISGGTYDDWLDAVYTHDRARSVESPIYVGGLMKELVFQEVISKSATNGENGQPLGTLGGRGVMSNKNKGGKIRIKVDEPSYIMGIISITPRITYSQGNKWDTNLETLNDFHKPALDEIGFQDLITDQMAWFDTIIQPGGNKIFKRAGKQPAWINYMTNVDQVRGQFAEENNSMFMTLNRRYENKGKGIEDLTTYIDPSKFNHIFAETDITAQNFWTQIRVENTARRKMSAKLMPNL